MTNTDPFTADTIRRSRIARERGSINGAWSTGEQLAVALVLKDKAHLERMDYTPQEAAQRVYGGMIIPPRDFNAWLADIRASL